MKKWVCLLLVFCCVRVGFAQLEASDTIMSKQELFDYYTSHQKNSRDCDTPFAHMLGDSLLEIRIRKNVAALERQGIDTLLVLINSFPKMYSADPHREYAAHRSVYIFWRSGGKEMVKKLSAVTGKSAVARRAASVFAFYGVHRDQMDKEFLMPIIYNGKRTKNGIRMSVAVTDGEREYGLFYHIHNACRSIYYQDSYLTSEDSPFTPYNKETAIYQWFLLLEDAVDNK